MIMRRVKVKRVGVKELYKRFFKKLDVVYEKIKKRGRLKKYKESLIYFAFAFKVARKVSYRDLEHQLKEIKKIKFSLIDATGFAFDDSFHLKMVRGKELRKVKSHIRLESIVAIITLL